MNIRTAFFYLSIFVTISAVTPADEIDDMISQLKSPDAFVCCYAAEQLGQLKDKRAVDPLLDLLENPQPLQPAVKASGDKDSAGEGPAAKVERAKRAVAGGNKHTEPAITLQAAELKQLTAGLNNRSFVAQKNAAKALGESQDKRAVPALVKALRDNRISESIKSDLIEALGRIGDPMAFDIIAEYLKKDEPFTKGATVAALGSLGDPRAAPLLYQAMADDFAVRREAAEALENLGGCEAVLYLNKALTHNDNFVRDQAQRTLDEMGPSHGLEPLLELLNDPDPQVKALAAQELARLNDPIVEFDLKNAVSGLSEQDRKAVKTAANQAEDFSANAAIANEISVKIAVIDALAKFRDVKIIKPLMRQLNDTSNDPQVRRTAGKALQQYQNRILLRTFETELKSTDHKQQAAALESLGYLGTDEAIDLIVPALDNAFLDDEAYKALAISRNPKILPYLHKALENPFVRPQALEGIKQMNDPSSAVAVAKLLATELMDVDERREIIAYLASSGNPAMIPYLKEPAVDAFVGDQVVDLLVKQDTPEILEPLVYVLVKGKQPQARQKSLEKLVQMQSPQTIGLLVQTILDMGPVDAPSAIRTNRDSRRLDRSVTLGLNDELPAALTQLSNKEHVDQLARLLPIPEIQDHVAGILKQFNWQPTTTEQKIYFYVATADWAACQQIGQPVVPYLLEKLKSSDSGELASVLAQMNVAEARTILLKKLESWCIGTSQAKVLQEAFNWKPATLQDKLNLAVSANDRKEILSLWKQDANIKQLIMNRLNEADDSSVEAVMRLCIRLGKEELVPAMTGRFQRMQDDRCAVSVANLFLSSGQPLLDQTARTWAEQKGYRVIETFMGSGSQWGS